MLQNIPYLNNIEPLHNQLHQNIGKMALAMVPEVSYDSSTITRDTLPPFHCQFYKDGNTTMLFVNINNSITYIGGNTLSAVVMVGPTVSTTHIVYYVNFLRDQDGDTQVQVEESPDEDIIRFDTGDRQGGVAGERATINDQGFAVTDGLKVIFDGRDGDTYWKYNNATAYLEGWVDGVKRVEL